MRRSSRGKEQCCRHRQREAPSRSTAGWGRAGRGCAGSLSAGSDQAGSAPLPQGPGHQQGSGAGHHQTQAKQPCRSQPGSGTGGGPDDEGCRHEAKVQPAPSCIVLSGSTFFGNQPGPQPVTECRQQDRAGPADYSNCIPGSNCVPVQSAGVPVQSAGGKGGNRRTTNRCVITGAGLPCSVADRSLDVTVPAADLVCPVDVHVRPSPAAAGPPAFWARPRRRHPAPPRP